LKEETGPEKVLAIALEGARGSPFRYCGIVAMQSSPVATAAVAHETEQTNKK
jgi:hypothetical protein